MNSRHPACFALLLLGTFLLAWQPANYQQHSHRSFARYAPADQTIDFASPDLPLLQAAVFYSTNAVRSQHQLAPLSFSPALSAAAQAHARYMATTDTVSHTGQGGSTMMQRLQQHGFQYGKFGENVANSFAYQYQSGQTFYPPQHGDAHFRDQQHEVIPRHTYRSLARYLVRRQWMQSPGHRRHILDPQFTQLGVGIAWQPAPDKQHMPMVFAAQEFAAPPH